MLLKPKIDYGSEVYSSASRSLLDSLEPIQNAALRIATGAFRTSPILSLRVESGIIKSLALSVSKTNQSNELFDMNICKSLSPAA